MVLEKSYKITRNLQKKMPPTLNRRWSNNPVFGKTSEFRGKSWKTIRIILSRKMSDWKKYSSISKITPTSETKIPPPRRNCQYYTWHSNPKNHDDGDTLTWDHSLLEKFSVNWLIICSLIFQINQITTLSLAKTLGFKSISKDKIL